MERAPPLARVRALVRGDDRHPRRRASPPAGSERSTSTTTRTARGSSPRRPTRSSARASRSRRASGCVVVVSGGAGRRAQTRPSRQAVHQLVADLTAAKATVDGVEQPTFDSVVDPFSLPPAQAAGVISPDGSTVQVVGNIPGERPIVEQKLVPVPAIVDAARARAAERPDPRHQQHVHQPRHQRADQRRARRLAAAHDPDHVPDPARGVRRDRRVGDPARARDHLARRRLRVPGPVQPGRRRRSARTRPS